MSGRVVEYCIVEADTPEYVAEQVSRLLPEGWQPFGGIAMTCYPSTDEWHNTAAHYWYAQALVRYSQVTI